MQHVLIIHEVADYAAWKRVFDRAAGIRHAAGERSYQVLRYEHDANRIVHGRALPMPVPSSSRRSWCGFGWRRA